MNYREQQLRQLIKKNYVPLEVTNELKKARAQDLIDKLQADLGINFLLADYQQIVKKLQGRTVEEVLIEKEQLKENIDNYLAKYQVNNFLQLSKLIQQGQKAQEENPLYLKKIEDLETQLLNLAKQKITNQKQARELVNQLENNWQKDKATWQEEKNKLTKEWDQQIKELEQNQQKIKDNWEEEKKTLLKNYHQEQKQRQTDKASWEQDKQSLITNHQQQIKDLETNWTEQKNQQQLSYNLVQTELTRLNQQLTFSQEESKKLAQAKKEQEEKITQQLGQIKRLQEEVNDRNRYYSQLEQEKQKLTEKFDTTLLEKTQQETQLYQQWEKDKEKWEEEKKNLLQQLTNSGYQQQQTQLKKINTLFDPNAKNYETIDFNGLYTLLQQIAERERERERAK